MTSSSLFGSSVRAGVLETLALTSASLSAYRLARVTGAQPIHVLTILKSLGPEVVTHRPGGWTLANDALRSFLRDQVRKRELERRGEKDELLARLHTDPRRRYGRH